MSTSGACVRIVIQQAQSVTNAELFTAVRLSSTLLVKSISTSVGREGETDRVIDKARHCQSPMQSWDVCYIHLQIYSWLSIEKLDKRYYCHKRIDSTRQPRSDYRLLIISSWPEDNREWQACLPSVLTINDPSLLNARHQRSSSFVSRCLLCVQIGAWIDLMILVGWLVPFWPSFASLIVFVKHQHGQGALITVSFSALPNDGSAYALITCSSHGC